MRIILSAVFLVFYGVSNVFAPLTPIAEEVERNVIPVEDVVTSDIDMPLALRFPTVPEDQVKNIGHFPETLRALLRGAEPDGRLILRRPSRSHALLMTTHHSSFPYKKIRAIGAVTDSAGKTSYFRSTPFSPHKVIPEFRGDPERYTITPDLQRIVVPPPDYDSGFYGTRKIALTFPNSERMDSEVPINLAHISIRPLGEQPYPVMTSVYPQKIWREVVAGRPTGAGQGKMINWSDTPNWAAPESKWKIWLRGSSSKRLSGASE